jgi:hypothetical protein
MTKSAVNDALVRALHEGPAVLPKDLHQLHAYLRLIAGLLAEKADEREPTWSMAKANGAEIETLQSLEHVVAGRAAEVEAATFAALLVKLSIWEILLPLGEESDDVAMRDRLVLSIRRDIEAMARASGA